MNGDQRSDEELTQQAGTDEQAFAELYRRYFPRVYDFALRLTRDREAAAAVAQSTFFQAHNWLRAGQAQTPFKIQLFAIANKDATERLRRGRGAVLEGEEAFRVADPSRLAQPVPTAEQPELARMAWQAAREMKTDEYELVDLHIRQQLDMGEIAAVLGTRQEAVERKLGRLSDTLEESFTALLLLSRGRRECLDLDFLAGDDRSSSAARRRILQHLQGCRPCQSTRRRYMSADEMLGALMLVPAPAGWQETILARLLEAARAGATAAGAAPTTAPLSRPPTDAFTAPAGGGAGIGDWLRRVFGRGGARGPLLAALLGGFLIVIVALAALCGAGAFDGGEAMPTATATTTATATATTTPTPTVTPTATATSTPLPTATPVPPTDTPVPPTAVPTDTPVPPTAVPTDTPVPPTDTPTP